MDSKILPPMDRIGENGEFEGLYQVIIIERAGERLFVAPNGERLGRVVKDAPVQHQPVVPAIRAENVMGIPLRRIGFKHDEGDLVAVHHLVQECREKVDRPLRVADLFGWSGEVALAMLPEDDESIVYSIDSMTGNGRDKAIINAVRGSSIELPELFKQNVGNLWGARVRLVQKEPQAQIVEFEQCQELDAVFVDTAADFSKLKGQMQEWVCQLAPTGILFGVNNDDTTVQQALEEVFQGCAVHTDSNSSVWYVTAEEWLAYCFPEKAHVGT